MKFGDNFNASIAQQQLILLRIIGEMILAVLHTHLSQKRIFIFCTVSYCFPPCLTLSFFPLLCEPFQMFDWISHNKELFLQSHTEIGVSYQHALDLQTQHNHFAMNSMVSWGHCEQHRREERASTGGHLQCSGSVGPVRGDVRKVRLAVAAAECCSVQPDTDVW